MTSTFVKLQEHKRPMSRWCMHCMRSATWSAIRKSGKMKTEVAYCNLHKELIIDQGATVEPDPFAGIVDVPYNEGKRA